MKEFRIIKQAGEFIVQKKCAWWWSIFRVVKHFNPHGPSFASIVRFKTLKAAQKYIEDQRPKNADEITVVETRLIF